MHKRGVKLAPDQHDPFLDNLPQLVEKKGKLHLSKARITPKHAIAIFQRFFPKGFEDPSYIGDKNEGERFYKWRAHEYFCAKLGGGEFRRLLSSDLPALVRLIEACGNMVGNMLSLYERAALRDALKDSGAAWKFLTTLADLLDADEITERTFAPYARAVLDLPADQGKVASWPVATLIPFLAQPERHMFLKPSVTNVAAESLAYQLNYRPELNWITYKCLLEMTPLYKAALADLRPKDFIDMQSFFWVVGGGYA